MKMACSGSETWRRVKTSRQPFSQRTELSLLRAGGKLQLIYLYWGENRCLVCQACKAILIVQLVNKKNRSSVIVVVNVARETVVLANAQFNSKNSQLFRQVKVRSLGSPMSIGGVTTMNSH